LRIVRRTAVGGYPTSSYKAYKSIDRFIDEQCPKEDQMLYWQIKVTHGRLASRYLRECADPDLPDYQPMWGVIAYADAVYEQISDTWWDHSDPRKPTHLVAQRYIPLLIDRTHISDDPFILKSPLMKILDDQNYTKEEKFMFSAMIGRCFFPLRRYDDFELILFMQGLAMTGKSTFINFIREFFDPKDVGKISNIQEQIFGLESIYDKMFAECSDVTRNFRMDNGDFLSICSGEYVAVKRKNKIQLSTKWNTPVVFAGNEFPSSWQDRKKNLLRRVFIADFPNSISPDLNFPKRIGETLSTSHRFFIVCYLKLVQQVKSSGLDIWTIIERSCPRFIENRAELLKQNSAMLAYLLTTPDIEVAPECYTREADFVEAFKNWCQTRGVRSDEARPERMKDILESQTFKIERGSRPWPLDSDKPKMREDNYIVGFRYRPQESADYSSYNNNYSNNNNNNNNNHNAMEDTSYSIPVGSS
jgi:hypothetical protein